MVSPGCSRAPAPANDTEPEGMHPDTVLPEDNNAEPIPVTSEKRPQASRELWTKLSEQDMERAIRELEVEGTRMKALETLIRFAGPKLYEGSVIFMSGDPDLDKSRKRAAAIVHSCGNIETVSQALDHSSRTLRGWGIMAFRTFSYGEKRDPRWVALLPKLMRFAEAPKDPHNVARQTFVELDGVMQPNVAPRFDRTVSEIQGPPPEVGEHSQEILRDWGFDPEAIAKLEKAGAV